MKELRLTLKDAEDRTKWKGPIRLNPHLSQKERERDREREKEKEREMPNLIQVFSMHINDIASSIKRLLN